jgi:biopolymer transport protein ExbB
MNETGSAGLVGFWMQADAVGRSAALLLFAMSLVTWYLILTKALQGWRVRRQAQAALDAFWSSTNLEEARTCMSREAPDSPYTFVVLQAVAACELHGRHGRSGAASVLDFSEFMIRAIRRGVQRASSGLDTGLSILASIGSTAPFIGLFGTVWGIYHALVGIGFTGQATIDKVAGPVGEALIMTAFGIGVAVPAVLAYNMFLRGNRVLREELDGFAHDLHAYVTTGELLSIPSDQHEAVTINSLVPQKGA